MAEVKREGTDVTVIAYMGMLHRALEAAEELEKEGISVEMVDPRTLRPMDTGTILDSVRKTHRAVVLEAGAGFAGLGAEIGTIVTESAFDYLDSPVVRVTGANAPMPYARNLEKAKTPSKGEDRGRHPEGRATHDHQGGDAEAVGCHGNRQGHPVDEEGR